MSDQYELTIVLPRYREEYEVIAESIQRIRKTFTPDACEVIVVNDGGTADVIERARRSFPDVTFIENPKNLGKGASIANGIRLATGRYHFYSDIDLPIDVDRLPRVIDEMRRDGYPMAIGTRRQYGQQQSNLYRRLTSRTFLTLFNLLIAADIKDSQCPFKLFESAYARFMFPRMSLAGYAFDAELIHMAKLQERRILQVDVPWTDTREPWGPVKTLAVFAKMIFDLTRIRLYWMVRRGNLREPDQS